MHRPSPHRPFHPLRRVILPGVGALLVATWLLGCSGSDFEPRTLVTHLRVLAVRADPPYFGFSHPVKLQLKTVGQPPQSPLCHAWALCLFTRDDQGRLECFDPDLQVDLGTGPTATFGLPQFMEAFSKLPAVLERYGMTKMSKSPGTKPSAPQNCKEGESPLPFSEIFVLFKVAERGALGGTCPKVASEMLHEICQDRSRCVSGFTQVLIAMKTVTHLKNGVCVSEEVPDPYKEHHNPVLEGLELNEIQWPAAVTPVLAPITDAQENGGGGKGFSAGDSQDNRGVELLPLLSKDSIEVSGKSLEAGIEDPTEQITYSWFSTAGDFTFGRSSDVAPNTRYLPEAPKSGKANPPVTLWLVARDGRGGVAWMERNVTVKSEHNAQGNPLCEQDHNLEGCPK